MRDNLVESNFKLVHYVISKMHITDKNNYDDFFQVGVIGLISASKNFNPNLKISFSTFAYVCIKNEILKYIKKDKEKYISLEDTLFDDVKVEDTIADENVNIIETIVIKENNEELYNAIGTQLDSTEQKVIKMLFGIGCKEYKQVELAEILNIPQYKISRIKNRVLYKLKNSIKI